jgi:hypothetical protein
MEWLWGRSIYSKARARQRPRRMMAFAPSACILICKISLSRREDFKLCLAQLIVGASCSLKCMANSNRNMIDLAHMAELVRGSREAHDTCCLGPPGVKEPSQTPNKHACMYLQIGSSHSTSHSHVRDRRSLSQQRVNLFLVSVSCSLVELAANRFPSVHNGLCKLRGRHLQTDPLA